MAYKLLTFCALGATVAAGALLAGQQPAPAAAPTDSAPACSNDAGLSLPPGFCATIFAEGLGHARQIAVAADGTVYVNTWMSRYFRGAPPEGGFIVALRDTNGDGKAEQIDRFGPSPAQGGTGGTGIALYRDGLYAEAGDRVVRYMLKPGARVPATEPTTIISDLPMTGDHMMHPIAIDAKGRLFLNSGSASNTCEKINRQPGSMGYVPCTELETRGGIWLYSADKTGQHFSPAERYATGIRNTGGMSFDAAGSLFAVQHGRDQLAQNWPDLYTSQQGSELPAEELLAPVKGDDFGWPTCYYDGFQKKRVLAPEFGGDGGKAVGACATKKAPVATFPAHFAPTGIVIYSGRSFPAAWRGGAFISFHGSWNRAPAPQDGYRITFQPLANGKASGPALLFADGFVGASKESGRAEHRPTGIAMGPDGALYVSDDVSGRIWRISYRGPAGAKLAAAAPVATSTAPAATEAVAPPPGFTSEQVALGDRIYRGLEREGTCSGCHGADGTGGEFGPPLNTGKWLWGDGSVAAIARAIADGVSAPKVYASGMPAKGGSPLSQGDVDAVAAYVWTLSQKK